MSSSAITGPVLSDVRRAPAGTAAAPSFAFNDSTGTGVYLVSAGVLGLSTAGVQRVVVDASGNVGIGTASPGDRLHVSSATAAGIRAVCTGATGADMRMYGSDGAQGLIGTFSNHVVTFYTNSTEKMRIDASGRLLVGTTTQIDGRVSINADVGNSGCIATTNNGLSTYYPAYFYHNGVLRGNIGTTAAGTAYATSSDYRLKEAVKPMTAALSRVAALKPCTYKWKSDGSEGEGFIAHELAEVCPAAVVGEKDAVNEDGSIKSQGIDPSKLVGLLTAAIQELSAKNEALEARLAALESKP